MARSRIIMGQEIMTAIGNTHNAWPSRCQGEGGPAPLRFTPPPPVENGGGGRLGYMEGFAPPPPQCHHLSLGVWHVWAREH